MCCPSVCLSVCLARISSETAEQIWLKCYTKMEVCLGGDRPMGVPPGEPNMYPGDWGDIVSVGLSLTKAS